MLKTSLWKSPHGRIVRLLSQVTDLFVYWLPGFSQWFWLREFLACMNFPSQPTSQAPCASVASSTWHRHFITCIATNVTTSGNIAAFSASRYCKLVGSGYKDIWSPVFPTSNKPDSGQLLLLLSFRQNLTEDLRNNEVVPYGRGANDHNRDLGIKSFPKSSQVNVSLLHENCSLPKN